jgi:hypothetical protein
MRRSGAIGIAHAHIDNVLTAAPGGELKLGGNVEDVRGKSVNAREVALARTHSHKILLDVSARIRPSDVTAKHIDSAIVVKP